MTQKTPLPPPKNTMVSGVFKIAAVASLGSFLAQLDATMVNVALANLAQEFQKPIPLMQWVVTGYLLALMLALPLSGYLADRIGMKSLYLACIAGFAVTALLCGLAWSANSLIVCRFLQGTAGGLLAPMAQMLIVRVAGGRLASVAGYVAIPILLGPTLGPIVASGLLHYMSWHWLFFFTSSFAALTLLLAAMLIPADKREDLKPRRMDWTGLALLAPALALLLYSLDHVVGFEGRLLLSVAGVLLLLFTLHARRRKSEALIDLELLHHRSFRISAMTQFIANGINFAGQMLVPMYLIVGCGRPPGDIGWLMAPLGIGMMCSYPFLSHVITRFGLRRVASAGAFLSLTAMALLAFTATRELSLAWLWPALILLGVGQSAVGLSSMTAAYQSIPASDIPMATTSLNIFQRLGGPVMTTISAVFLDWRMAVSGKISVPFGAFSTTFLGLSLVLLLCLLATFWLPKQANDNSPR